MSSLSDVYGEEGVQADAEAGGGNDFEALPPGSYSVEIEKATTNPCKAYPNVPVLNLQLRVLDGKFAKRVLFDRINLVSTNNKPAAWKDGCINASAGRLARLGAACGLAALRDETELIGKVVDATIRVVDFGGKPDNEVSGYKAPGSAPAAAKPAAASPAARTMAARTAAAAPAASAAPATTPPKRPWQK